MSAETGEQLRQCLELLTKIRKEYPEGDFDREIIHGEMDFRYRQIKEDREKLEIFPKIVRDFARLVESLASPDEEVKKFFQPVSVEPHKFSALANLRFHERQKKLEEWAKDSFMAIPSPCCVATRNHTTTGRPSRISDPVAAAVPALRPRPHDRPRPGHSP